MYYDYYVLLVWRIKKATSDQRGYLNSDLGIADEALHNFELSGIFVKLEHIIAYFDWTKIHPLLWYWLTDPICREASELLARNVG